MKMKPPARSKSPTSRKKPRIMRHLILSHPKAQPAINGMAAEIQPHQHVIGVLRAGLPVPGGPEAVDAAKRALYKGANGGGGNAAAAVLFAGPARKHLYGPRDGLLMGHDTR